MVVSVMVATLIARNKADPVARSIKGAAMGAAALADSDDAIRSPTTDAERPQVMAAEKQRMARSERRIGGREGGREGGRGGPRRVAGSWAALSWSFRRRSVRRFG